MNANFRRLLMLLTAATTLAATSAMAGNTAKEKLRQLATDRFGQDIRRAQLELFEAAANGRDADCTSFPAEDRIIRGDRLAWLCKDPDASAQVTYVGISIIGAEIDGEVNLESAKISFPLLTGQCVFADKIILQNSHVFALYLLGTSIKDLQASGLVVEGSIFLRAGFKAQGEVDLGNAKIGEDLDCSGGEFVSQGGADALNVNAAKIEGRVFLSNGFKAQGEVDLGGAKIGSNLECDGGEFVSQGGADALNVSSAKIEGSVFLRHGFKAQGQVNLGGAKIGSNLECDGGEFVSQGGADALNVSSAKIEGSVFLRHGFKAQGSVVLQAAEIGEILNCTGGQFFGGDKVLALDISASKFRGSFFKTEISKLIPISQRREESL